MWGATILAGALFFVLNVGSGLIVDNETFFWALLSGAVKTAIFATLFHYLHNWISARLGWYEKEE